MNLNGWKLRSRSSGKFGARREAISLKMTPLSRREITVSPSATAWRNPEALTQRVQLATTLGQRSGVSAEKLSATLGASVSEPTRRTLASEPAGQQVALLLASPDFMKR